MGIFKKLWKNIIKYQFYIALIAVVLVTALIVSCIVASCGEEEIYYASSNISSITIETSSLVDDSSDVLSSSDISSSETEVSSSETTTSAVSSEPVSSEAPVVSEPVSSAVQVQVPVDASKFKYNTNINIEDNIFMDSMVYTGYNLAKHRSDGLMWVYVLSGQKPAKGWLSKISYDYDGGTSGYETNAQGLPDIAFFERNDLVCASYATYVYFNYLPNVAGIDTSSLTKPANPTLANDWYKAAKDWVNKGYSYEIPFTASRSGNSEIRFKASQDIPIGSIILCNDMNDKSSDWACHVSIYAGYKNGYHWVYHVGNDNGPEFCAIERFCYGPDPVWPLSVISTPTNIRMSALIDVSFKDQNGNPVSGVSVSLAAASGTQIDMGASDELGFVSKDGLAYGDYTLNFTLPEGYTATTTQAVSLTPKNNSHNAVEVVCSKTA